VPTDATIGGDGSNRGLGPEPTAYDRDLIHSPGAIQPHGLLLIADAATRQIVGVAGDVEARLASRWEGRSLDDVLGIDVTALLAREDANDEIPVFGVDGVNEQFVAVLRPAGAHLLVELELQDPNAPSAAEILVRLDSIVNAFERAPDVQSLCERAAIAFRQLTAFDRVVVYRFLENGTGFVLAEDRDPVLPSFLNRHFPASDIPKQVRALYIRNRVRSIPDIFATPALLRGGTGVTQIDLGEVALRAAPPVHLQFLRNVGVRASASVAIVKDGLLWGLVACHHNTPRRLNYATRAAARTLAGALGRQIRAKEAAQDPEHVVIQ